MRDELAEAEAEYAGKQKIFAANQQGHLWVNGYSGYSLCQVFT